jgi:hypothetical protein
MHQLKLLLASLLILMVSFSQEYQHLSGEDTIGDDIPNDIIKKILSQGTSSPAYIAKPIPTGKDAYTEKNFLEDYQAWWRRFWRKNLKVLGFEEGSKQHGLAVTAINSAWVDSEKFHVSLRRIRGEKPGNPFFDYLNGWVPSSSSTAQARKLLQASLSSLEKSKADPIAKVIVLQAVLSRDRQFYNEKYRDKMQNAFLESAEVREKSDPFRLKYWIKNADEYGIINTSNKKNLQHLTRNKNIHPYIRQICEGELYIKKAWEIRGSGWAYKVTPEGWEGFRHHMKLAKEALLEGYRLYPEHWAAPYQLIIISAAHGGIGPPRMWLDRAIASRVELKKAYSRYYSYIMPRWGGSHEMIHDFARECWETKAYHTEVPYMYLEMHEFIMKDYKPSADYLSQKGVIEETEDFFNESNAFSGAKRNKEFAAGYLSAMTLSAGRWEDHEKYRSMLNNKNTPKKLLKRFNLTSEIETFSRSKFFRNAVGHEKKILTYLALASYDQAIQEGYEWMISHQKNKDIFLMLMNSLIRIPFKEDQPDRNIKLMKILLHHQHEELALRKFRYLLIWLEGRETDPSIKIMAKMLEKRFSKFEVDAIRSLPTERPLSSQVYAKEEKRLREVFAHEKGLSEETLNFTLLRIFALEVGTPFSKKIKTVKALVKKVKSRGKLNEVCFAWSTWYYNNQQLISLIHSSYRSNFQWLNYQPKTLDKFIKDKKKINPDSFRKFYLKEGEPTVAFSLEYLSEDQSWCNLAWRYAWSTRRWFKEYARVYNYSANATYPGLQAHLKAEGQEDHALFFAEKHFKAVTHNSGALLCAYVFNHHGMVEKAKAALKKASSLKKDGSKLYLPDGNFKNTKELEKYLTKLILKK